MRLDVTDTGFALDVTTGNVPLFAVFDHLIQVCWWQADVYWWTASTE